MQKGFQQQTKKILKGSSQSTVRYWRYLDSLEDSQNIYHFCMKMYESLISSSKDQFLDDDHEAMYSTLLILEFYKNTKLKNQKWLEQSLKQFQQNKPRLFENAKWILKMFIQNSQQSQFAMHFLSSICHIPQKFSWQVEPGQQIQQSLTEASDYYDIIQFKRKDKPYKKLSNLSYWETIKESKINTFFYCCYLDYIRSSNYQPKKKIWMHILDNLKGLIHSLRFTAKAYQLLSIQLHIIGTMVKYYGCVYEQILKEMIYYMNVLRNSPGQGFALASQIFHMLHLQLKCPGSAFRKQLKKRFVNLDYKKSEYLSSSKYLLTYRKINFTAPEHCSINNLRKLIIYNILGCCKVDNINKLWSMVEPLDVDTTYNLYFKIMRIIDISVTLQTYQSIQKLIKESIGELFKLGWTPYRKIRKEEESQLQNLIINQNTQKYFQFPSFEIIQIKPQQLLNSQYEFSIVSLFQQLRQQPYNRIISNCFLQFVFVGNDQQLNRVLNKICEYLIDLPIHQFKKLVFYLVPMRQGDCYLAQYLSYKDVWYRRHIYNAFRQKLIFPYVPLDEPQLKETFPSYLFNKSLQMYIREAQRNVPFQIYECTVEFVTSSQAKKIYFINNLLIGASLQCEILKNDVKKQKKNTYNDGLEIYLQKVKKIPPIFIDIQVDFKQPGTNVYPKRIQKFVSVEDLQICNTPRPYFFGCKPNPLSETIQLSLLTSVAAKVFKSQLQSRQNFKRHSDSQIAEAFRDLFINITCQNIIIQRSEGMKEGLKIQIDGIEITDVQGFSIKPAVLSEQDESKQKYPLTLPVRCFLPFQA